MAVKPSSRLILQGFWLHPTNDLFPRVLWFSHSSPGMFGTGSFLPFPRSDPPLPPLCPLPWIQIPKLSTLSPPPPPPPPPNLLTSLSLLCAIQVLSCQHSSKHWTSKQHLNPKKISYFLSHFIFHCFWPSVKCHFVAWGRELCWKCADCVCVPINQRLLKLSRVASCFRRLAVILLLELFFFSSQTNLMGQRWY